MLSYTRYPDLDFTHFVSSGYTSIGDWLNTIGEYGQQGMTSRELYDLQQQSNLFSNDEIKRILDVAVANIPKHKEGRQTALVVGSPSQFGISRMYELMSEVEGVRTETQVFYKLDQAIDWLGQDVVQWFRMIAPPPGDDA
jgi:hypothetical protein